MLASVLSPPAVTPGTRVTSTTKAAAVGTATTTTAQKAATNNATTAGMVPVITTTNVRHL